MIIAEDSQVILGEIMKASRQCCTDLHPIVCHNELKEDQLSQHVLGCQYLTLTAISLNQIQFERITKRITFMSMRNPIYIIM